MALGRVVLLDALGTLVELDAPAPRLTAELRARGLQVQERQAAAALRAEIAYYREHHDMASDAASLDLLRDRCADVLRGALEDAGCIRPGAGNGVEPEITRRAGSAPFPAPAPEITRRAGSAPFPAPALEPGQLRAALLAALRFVVFDDVPAALAELRGDGHRLVVVSNWDVSLHDMLRETGLDALVDGALSSAEAGARKPAPEIFRRALAIAGAPDRSERPGLHVGDSLELDVAGALGAGLEAVLVARAGAPDGVPHGVPVLTRLDGLAALAA